jgi:hypothetical protein
MSNEPEEFEQLRKLLRLKRYEQPPPRFFNEFSGRVIAGIETEAAQNPAERLLARASWLAGFFRTLERNALVAGSFVTSVCALLIGGIVYSEYMDQTADASSPVQPMPSRMAEAAGYLPVESSSLEPVPVFSPSNSLPDSLFRRVSLPTLQDQKPIVQQINWNVPVPQ